MSDLGMAIGTAAGSIFGSLIGNKMQQDQFGNQLTLMKKQHEYNEASANAAQERAYEMWEKTNYAAQINQMKKAGLSPALMYGQAGAGGGTVSGAQGQGTSQPTDRSIEMKLRGQEMGLQLANLASQIKLNGSQANKRFNNLYRPNEIQLHICRPKSRCDELLGTNWSRLESKKNDVSQSNTKFIIYEIRKINTQNTYESNRNL